MFLLVIAVTYVRGQVVFCRKKRMLDPIQDAWNSGSALWIMMTRSIHFTFNNTRSARSITNRCWAGCLIRSRRGRGYASLRWSTTLICSRGPKRSTRGSGRSQSRRPRLPRRPGRYRGEFHPRWSTAPRPCRSPGTKSLCFQRRSRSPPWERCLAGMRRGTFRPARASG